MNKELEKNVLDKQYYNNGNYLSLEEIKIVFSDEEIVNVTVKELLELKKELSKLDEIKKVVEGIYIFKSNDTKIAMISEILEEK